MDINKQEEYNSLTFEMLLDRLADLPGDLSF